jgi:membrane-associated PAP2 superfamily phosphatase
MFAALRLMAWADLDLKVQDQLFDFTSYQWLVTRDAAALRLVLYSGPKLLFIAAAVALLVLVLWPGRKLELLPKVLRSRDRRRLGFVLASMVLLPTVVAIMKDASRVPCPYDVDRYGGELPHLQPFEPESAANGGWRDRRGCFPAAHASGAFSLMSLYFVARRRRQGILLLAGAVALGWLTGGYQMARGAHFLSHTLATMLIAWPMVTLLAWVFGLFPDRSVGG